MGCFSIQQGRHRAKHRLSPAVSSSLAHPSLKILKELKIGGLSSHLNNSCNNKGITQYCNAPRAGLAAPYTQARAVICSASSKLVKHHTKALTSSSFSKVQGYHEKKADTNGCGFAGERSNIYHSAPLLPSPIDVNENTHLFPLPLPPIGISTATVTSEDASLQSSASSTSSGSSSSSCSSAPFSGCSVSAFSQSYKSYDNPLSARSVRTQTNAMDTKALPSCLARPLPLPPASEMGTPLTEYSYDELAGACLNFAQEFFIRDGGAGSVFKALIRRNLDRESAVDIAVTRLSRGRLHSFKKWRAEVGTLARLSHPNICKVLGFSREDPSAVSDKVAYVQRERLLVYEHPSNGSLESLLYGRKSRAPLDWATRARIALGAAQGLAFLHEKTPRQIVYKSFKTLNIQVDHNFNAKLSDYGFARTPKELPFETPARSLPMDDVYAAPETRSYNEVTSKSNVWSFGIVLLELLTGRQNMDDFFVAEERNLLQWCRPYLLDPKRLYLVMDPELKGRYPTKRAKMLADLALLCLAEDSAARPSMRDVASSLLWLTTRSDTQNTKVEQSVLSNGLHDNDNGYVGLGSSIKSMYARSYSIASVLASPARSFTSSLHSNELCYSYSKTTSKGFLSGEITRESSLLLAGSRGEEHPFLARSLFLSGEVMVHAGKTRLHRSSSSSRK